MKKSKPKIYVLSLAKNFMKSHPRAGQLSLFYQKIKNGEKIHTLRQNYELWKHRVDQINNGIAILSLREWTGLPYRSRQRELTSYSKLGIQKLEWDPALGWFIDDIDSDYTIKDFAPRDGLSIEDFKAWFKKYPVEPMAIIHFTDFRY